MTLSDIDWLSLANFSTHSLSATAEFLVDHALYVCTVCTVCPHKNKTNYFLAYSVIKLQLNALIFWYSDLRDNCESTYNVGHITCVTDTLHFVDKQNSQTVKPQIQKILSINLTHWTTKTLQNVLKMSSVSRDTSRETAIPLTDGCNNNRMVPLFAFN